MSVVRAGEERLRGETGERKPACSSVYFETVINLRRAPTMWRARAASAVRTLDLVLLSQNAAFEVFENHIMKEIPVGT
jgi:hypothetical protein